VVLFFGKLQFFLKFLKISAFALTMEAASFFFGFGNALEEKDTADSVLKRHSEN
jgi:hypothetical protein